MITTTLKPRVIKDYDRLEKEIQEQIKLEYPYGFEESLISFTNREGKRVSALPFETEEKYYLVRMTVAEAMQLIEDDEGYDEEGKLRAEAKVEYEENAASSDEEKDPYAEEDEEEEGDYDEDEEH